MPPMLRAIRRVVFWGFTWTFPLLLQSQNMYLPDGGEYSLTTGMLGDQTHPRLSLSGSGGYIVWADNATDGDGLGISARALNNSFSPVIQRTFRVNQTGAGDQENPDVKLLGNGGAVFVWQGGAAGRQHIYARFLAADGTFATGDIPVNTYTADQQVTPAAAALADGNVAVIWSSFGQDGSMQGVFGQRLSTNGLKLGGEFQVNQFTSFNQRSPAVAPLPGGGFVVVWISEQQRFENSVDVFGRRYAADGTPSGGEFLVNTATNACANPFVIADAGGGFTIAWSQLNLANPTDGWDVFLRSFDEPATAKSVPVPVNQYKHRNQYAPQISTINSVSLIVWTSDGQDGSREGIFGRFMDGGTLTGNEFEINTTWQSQQLHPTVSCDGARRFLVAWSGYRNVAAGFELSA